MLAPSVQEDPLFVTFTQAQLEQALQAQAGDEAQE
jgi:hypothetical protein